MDERLKALAERRQAIEDELAGAGTWDDPRRAAELTRELGEITRVLDVARDKGRLEAELAEARSLTSTEDDEMRAMAEEEAGRLEAELARCETELKALLIPADPRDAKDVMIEIRAGTGGDEAALFAADLLRMYEKYAETRGWQVEILDANPTPIGGFKEVIASVKGRGAYSRLRFESGVHRVQRVPETEAQGRIHTSTATVAVLPEPEEVEVEIRPEELRIDTYRSSGAGGQHVNKTESAIRITHLPSGIVVTCQDEKSQHKNRERAMRVLRARLYERASAAAEAEVAEDRRSQIGSGDRSERVRTYNFPQGRVSDHRIGLTLYRLPEVLAGDLDELVAALQGAAEARRLS